jgi:hypothetical protein
MLMGHKRLLPAQAAHVHDGGRVTGNATHAHSIENRHTHDIGRVHQREGLNTSGGTGDTSDAMCHTNRYKKRTFDAKGSHARHKS